MEKSTKINWILKILIIFSLFSCNQDKYRAHDYQWKWAEESCKNKGGARYYNTNSRGCKCHNGEWVSGKR